MLSPLIITEFNNVWGTKDPVGSTQENPASVNILMGPGEQITFLF